MLKKAYVKCVGLTPMSLQNTLIAWKNYLKSKNACNAAIESLEEAWKEYSAV